MSTDATADPIRAEVERWLHAAVQTVLAAPFVVVGAVPRCLGQQAGGIAARMRQPWDVVRSVFELVASPTTAPVETEPLGPTTIAPPVERVDSPSSSELPIDEYESLAAGQVVARLASLTPSELAAVQRFERAHRGRRTVLGKIEQLLGRDVIDPHVRRAGAADAAALADLELEARGTLVDARGGRRWLDEHPAIDVGWADAVSRRTVLVAELPEEAAPVGHVVGYLVLDVTGAVAHVDQVYVTPGARELGFGDALLERATAEARRAGATLLEGHALPGDRETKNLYERAGITARLITVSRVLG